MLIPKKACCKSQFCGRLFCGIGLGSVSGLLLHCYDYADAASGGAAQIVVPALQRIVRGVDLGQRGAVPEVSRSRTWTSSDRVYFLFPAEADRLVSPSRVTEVSWRMLFSSPSL